MKYGFLLYAGREKDWECSKGGETFFFAGVLCYTKNVNLLNFEKNIRV